jgi:3-oxoacyl-[acyl-carrier protein] reductase
VGADRLQEFPPPIGSSGALGKDMVVLVTGASRGIGHALAAAAAREGHDVAVNYLRNAALAHALVGELACCPSRVIAIQADVSAADEAKRLVETTVERLGQIDCVVNNAGGGAVTPLDKLDEATFARTLQVNLVSAFLVSQAAWPHMKTNGGRLVFLSSGAARTGGGLSAAYAASKAGVEGLMHYYATALRPYRITANAIAPTLVKSDLMNLMAPQTTGLPLGRLGRVEEIWPALRMIIETEYLTGQTIHIDAGRYMT